MPLCQQQKLTLPDWQEGRGVMHRTGEKTKHLGLTKQWSQNIFALIYPRGILKSYIMHILRLVPKFVHHIF